MTTDSSAPPEADFAALPELLRRLAYLADHSGTMSEADARAINFVNLASKRWPLRLTPPPRSSRGIFRSAIMLDLRVMSGAEALPLFDLPAAFGREQAARALGDTIEGLITFLDDLGGDPDLDDSEAGNGMVDDRGRFLGDVPAEQDEDREPDGDAQGDQSWPEWHTRGRQVAGRPRACRRP